MLTDNSNRSNDSWTSFQLKRVFTHLTSPRLETVNYHPSHKFPPRSWFISINFHCCSLIESAPQIDLCLLVLAARTMFVRALKTRNNSVVKCSKSCTRQISHNKHDCRCKTACKDICLTFLFYFRCWPTTGLYFYRRNTIFALFTRCSVFLLELM